jgi:D-threo-aldose 1-dehydrogenase
VTVGHSAGDRRSLGRTGIAVTSLALGTSGLGGMPALYGYDVDAERAIATLTRALDSPIRFIDTGNGYAASEARVGEAIARHGGLPDDYLLQTKVDPAPGSTDFSGARVRRSVEESLDRLGLDHLRILHLHDPERLSFEEAMAPDGPVEALIALRDEGVVDHLGVAGGTLGAMLALVETDIFDVVLTHSRFTLLDRSVEPLLDLARDRGLGVLNAAPFAGGLMSGGSQPGYAYSRGDEVIRDSVAGMLDVSRRFGVPLLAAALQLSVRDERIDSTVVGMSSPARIDETLGLLDVSVPGEMWTALDEFVLPPERWLN